MKYWKECISIAADECDLDITEEQLEFIAEAVEGGFENYDTAHGYDVMRKGSETEAERELRRLKKEIEKKERWKSSTEPCRACYTTGWLEDVFGREVECGNCSGKGRVRKYY